MAFPLLNRVRQAVLSAPGTGAITLGAATSPLFQTFAQAGARDGILVNYVLEDGTNAWEYGEGVYSSAGPTLTRATIKGSSNSGNAINASISAIVFCDLFAEDAAPPIGWARVDSAIYQPALRGTGYAFNGLSLNVLADRLYAVSFSVPRRQTFTKIGARVQTAAAGGTGRLALYQESPAGQPGKLLVDGGSFGTDTTGNKEVTINITLNPGRYFICAVYAASYAMAGFNFDKSNFEAIDSGMNGIHYMLRNFTYATPFGDETGSTFTYPSQQGANIYWMRN